MSMTVSSNTCPVCRGWVARQGNGMLFPHARYVDGGGYGPDRPHDQVPCEGSNGAPADRAAQT
jgi:hypothetical protein